jgi:DNA-binding CsgD family transcriptional regulator
LNQVPAKQASLLPESFALFDRSSGSVLFRVEADPQGGIPVEKAAGLLAVHCLMRGQAPEDYEVMVIAKQSFLRDVSERAQQLINAGRAIEPRVKISPREQEVLDGIVQSMANKEIASRLHVSERTVKFHVSSLLAKFGVSDRIALSREAVLGRSSGRGERSPEVLGFPQSPDFAEGEAERVESLRNSSNQDKSHNRIFSIFPRVRYAT